MAKSMVRTSLQLSSEMRGGESVPSHSPQIFSPRREGLYGFIFGVSPLVRLICQRGFLKVQRLPLLSSGAALLGAAAWWLCPLEQG